MKSLNLTRVPGLRAEPEGSLCPHAVRRCRRPLDAAERLAPPEGTACAASHPPHHPRTAWPRCSTQWIPSKAPSGARDHSRSGAGDRGAQSAANSAASARWCRWRDYEATFVRCRKCGEPNMLPALGEGVMSRAPSIIGSAVAALFLTGCARGSGRDDPPHAAGAAGSSEDLRPYQPHISTGDRFIIFTERNGEDVCAAFQDWPMEFVAGLHQYKALPDGSPLPPPEGAAMTFTKARAECRQLGFTLKRTGCGNEVVLKDRGAKDEDGYFTGDMDDAAATARAKLAVRVEQAERKAGWDGVTMKRITADERALAPRGDQALDAGPRTEAHDFARGTPEQRGARRGSLTLPRRRRA